MCRWAEGGILAWASWDLETEQGRARLTQGLEAAERQTRNVVGQTLEVVQAMAHVVELQNEETGEITTKIRCVLFLANGERVSTVSEPCIKVLAWLCRAWGPGPWGPPRRLRFKENRGKGPNTYCTVSEVVDAIDAEVTAKNGTTKRK